MRYVHPIKDLEQIEQMKNILKNRSYRNYFLFVLGINSGLRISDMLRLRVSDIKGKEYIIVTEPLTGRRKKHYINPGLRKEINSYTQGMERDDYLFPSRTGHNLKPITRVMAYLILSSAGQQIGLGEIGTETLRKTFGYHYYQRTGDITLIQELFNHNKPSITRKYIGIRQDWMANALEYFSL